MNNYKSMTYYFNKISDLIKTKMYVDKGPLEPQQTKPKEINNNTEQNPTISSMSEFFKQHKESVDINETQNEVEITNEVIASNNSVGVKKTKQEQAIEILREEFCVS